VARNWTIVGIGGPTPEVSAAAAKAEPADPAADAAAFWGGIIAAV
jgi:hypothetical protein